MSDSTEVRVGDTGQQPFQKRSRRALSMVPLADLCDVELATMIVSGDLREPDVVPARDALLNRHRFLIEKAARVECGRLAHRGGMCPGRACEEAFAPGAAVLSERFVGSKVFSSLSTADGALVLACAPAESSGSGSARQPRPNSLEAWLRECDRRQEKARSLAVFLGSKIKALKSMGLADEVRRRWNGERGLIQRPQPKAAFLRTWQELLNQLETSSSEESRGQAEERAAARAALAVLDTSTAGRNAKKLVQYFYDDLCDLPVDGEIGYDVGRLGRRLFPAGGVSEGDVNSVILVVDRLLRQAAVTTPFVELINAFNRAHATTRSGTSGQEHWELTAAEFALLSGRDVNELDDDPDRRSDEWDLLHDEGLLARRSEGTEGRKGSGRRNGKGL